MAREKRPYICPAEFAGSLDNYFRKLVHNPRKILEPFIKKNMTILDLGCGPGYFTRELASLVGEEGKVIAADLQHAMLEKLIMKIRGTDLEQRVEIHKCLDDSISIAKKVDFVLAFWMVHEVPDLHRLFGELKSILNPDGRIFIVEPKIHVRERSFRKMITYAESAGFEITENPKVRLSRSVILSIRTPIQD
jgi:ubiquinone/menaquinone biosynthesis C-methylase UbiE